MLKNEDFKNEKNGRITSQLEPADMKGIRMRWIWLMNFPFFPLSTGGSSQISTK